MLKLSGQALQGDTDYGIDPSTVEYVARQVARIQAIVRRAYQAMLAWAQSFSLPRRRAGETPLLYAATLSAVLPAGQAAFQALTGAYLQARYGAQPPTLAQARAAQSALAELQALGASLVQPRSRPVD